MTTQIDVHLIASTGQILAATDATNPDQRIDVVGPGFSDGFAGSPTESGWSGSLLLKIPDAFTDSLITGPVSPYAGSECRIYVAADSLMVGRIVGVVEEEGAYSVSLAGREAALREPVTEPKLTETASIYGVIGSIVRSAVGSVGLRSIHHMPTLVVPDGANWSLNTPLWDYDDRATWEIAEEHVLNVDSNYWSEIVRRAEPWGLTPFFDRCGIFCVLAGFPTPWHGNTNLSFGRDDCFSTDAVITRQSLGKRLSRAPATYSFRDDDTAVAPYHVDPDDVHHSALAGLIVDQFQDPDYALAALAHKSAIRHPDRRELRMDTAGVHDIGSVAWVDTDDDHLSILSRIVGVRHAWGSGGGSIVETVTVDRLIT